MPTWDVSKVRTGSPWIHGQEYGFKLKPTDVDPKESALSAVGGADPAEHPWGDL
jgi:hypothetical protein